ncbi:MAG: transglycosylase domain-containing protein [Patescibacteria group bacterium]
MKFQSRRLQFRAKYGKQKRKQKLIFYASVIILGGLIFTFLGFAWFAKDLPAPGKLSQASSASSVFYDREGEILFETYKDKNRVPIELKDVSEHLKNATIAIEDKNFYKHKGISQTGILRAVINIVFKREIQGGSTITQQLIKNVLLTPQQTIPRKVKEIILAVMVEQRYTKDEIFQMYLNEAPYGGSFWGVGSAAKGYFDKAPKDLSIVESAFLAGLPQRPNVYSPFYGRNDSWKQRSKDVLRRMREDKYITKKEEESALVTLEKLKFEAPNLSINAPHFVFYIRELIEEEFGTKILDQGIKVTTTLSLDAQTQTQKIVNGEIKKLKGANVGNGAAVVLDSQTGEILAMVGSYDFNNTEFGRFNAATGLRQPGSAIKPLTYALALEKGYTPSTVIMDLSTVFPNQGQDEYVPVNYDNTFRGPVQIRFALANSINVPAVKMLALVGIKDFLQKAQDLGLETLAPTQANLNRFGLALTLGGGEVRLLDLTTAYSSFARGGTYLEENGILEIKDSRGKSIFKAKKANQSRVFSEETSFIISHILSDNIARSAAFGTNSFLNISGKTVSVKTGTTNDKRDNWTVGYTKGITAGVWVGNNDNSPMDASIASGVTGASPIWNKIMTTLLKDYDDGIIDQPSKVKALTVDAYLGGLPKEGYPTRSEYFIEGTEPKEVSPFYKKLNISRSTGNLANDVEIRSGNYDEREFIVITESDPVSTDGVNRWQEAIDAWSRGQGDAKYHYPTEKSTENSDSVVVSFRSPSDKQKIDSNNVEVTIRITSIENIKSAKLFVDGSEVKSYSGDRDEIKENLNLPDGVHELKVEVTNEKDKKAESTIKIGIKTDVTD